MRKNGFTLIELLATILILALLMLVAVPNVMSTIDKNKQDTDIADAKRMVTLTEYEIRSTTDIEVPTNGNCIVVKLNALDTSSLEDAPEGGTYDYNNSFVVVARSGSSYLYYVTLIENYDSGKRGVNLTSRDNLNDEDARKYVVRDSEFTTNNISVGSTLQLDGNNFTISGIVSNA